MRNLRSCCCAFRIYRTVSRNKTQGSQLYHPTHGRKGRLQIQQEHERAPPLFKRNKVHEIVRTPGQLDYQPVQLFRQHNLTAEPRGGFGIEGQVNHI
jgi:hypothetical protein